MQRPPARRGVCVDLFSGLGGLSLGMEQAGFDVVCAVEYDPVHAAAHLYNFPLCDVVCADLADLDTDALLAGVRRGLARHDLPADTPVDAVVGGPPCQGFSLMGKRLVDDPRNQLVFHFVRAVLALQPRWLAMENVPGMAAGGHGSILQAVRAELAEGGYRTRDPQILNARDFGVAQDRKRLFLLGARHDAPLPEPPAPTHAPRPRRPTPGTPPPHNGASVLPAGPSVAQMLADLPDADLHPDLEHSDTWPGAPLTAPACDQAAAARGLTRAPGDLSHPRAWDPQALTASARTRHTQTSRDRFAATAPGSTEPKSRLYRPHPDGLCCTLRAGTGSERGAHTAARPLHPVHPRVLTVREAARLHGMPDWMRPHATKWHGFRQVGNAVCPPVGRAVGHAMVAAGGLHPALPGRPVALGDETLLHVTMTEAAQRLAASALPQRKRAG